MRRSAEAGRQWSAWQRYGAAVVLTLLVVAGRLALDDHWGRHRNRHLVFFPTVMLAAWLGGLGPGLLSTAISIVAIAYFWTEPIPGLLRINPELVLFSFISVAICGLIASLRVARARAEAAKRSLEHLLAVVAHDLRNPLSAVRMAAANIQGMPLDAESLRRRLGSIDRAVSRMDRLIGDLVDATRIEHSEFAMNIRDEPVESIVQEVVDLYSALAEESGVAIELAASHRGSVISCDRDRLLQAIGNLMGNAIKFTPDGGRVTLLTHDEDDAVTFEVKDTGPGIKPENRPHIFERYWNSDGRGTGLGLFIAQSIVRSHGSELGVKSEPGRGASFFFKIPRAARASLAPQAVDGSSQRNPQPTSDGASS